MCNKISDQIIGSESQRCKIKKSAFVLSWALYNEHCLREDDFTSGKETRL